MLNMQVQKAKIASLIFLSSNDTPEKVASSKMLQVKSEVDLSQKLGIPEIIAHFKHSQARYYPQKHVKADLMLFAVLPRPCSTYIHTLESWIVSYLL